MRLPLRLRNVLSPDRLGQHRYVATLPVDERNGLVYTCRGGVIDIGHVRTTIDRLAFLHAGAETIEVQGGTARFTHSATTAAGHLDAASRAAYDLAVWHEVATSRRIGWRPYFHEGFSTFSPEDLYSDLLGAIVGARAVQSPLPFEEAVDVELDRALRLLGALDAPGSDRALDLLAGVWWRPEVMVPSSELLAARRYDRDAPLLPWRLADDQAQQVGCGGARAAELAFSSDPTPYRLTLPEAEPGFREPPPTPWVPVQRIQSIRLLPAELFAGALVDGAGPTPLFGARVLGGEAKTWGGDVRLIRFSIAHDADEEALAFNIVGIEASSLFSCSEEGADRSHPPIGAWFQPCEPGGGIGLGFRLLQLQYDGRTGRTVIRPVEVTAELDVLQNAFTSTYLFRHLVLGAGVGLDNVKIESRDGLLIPRGLALLRLVLGDDEGRWELRLRSAYRQSVRALDDRSVETSLRLTRRVFLGTDVRRPGGVVRLGVELGHSHFGRPEHSIADTALPVVTPEEPHTFHGVLFVGARFESLTF